MAAMAVAVPCRWTAILSSSSRRHRDPRASLSFRSYAVPLGESNGGANDRMPGKSNSQLPAAAETIAAIVTPVSGQHGAVAIVRLSGPLAVPITRRIFRLRKNKEWTPLSHKVQYGLIVDSESALLDEVLLVPMLAPKSYTREDVVEIQCHGGNVCVRRILELCLTNGARLAQPGEFTLRAFLNGRIDLSQAENVSELIAAKTDAAAEAALAGMQGGGLSAHINSMRNKCIDLLAEIEARLDFDDDLPPLNIENIVLEVKEIRKQVDDGLATSNRGHLLRSGVQVAIVGRPNVGKSSLLNAWSQVEREGYRDQCSWYHERHC